MKLYFLFEKFLAGNHAAKAEASQANYNILSLLGIRVEYVGI